MDGFDEACSRHDRPHFAAATTLAGGGRKGKMADLVGLRPGLRPVGPVAPLWPASTPDPHSRLPNQAMYRADALDVKQHSPPEGRPKKPRLACLRGQPLSHPLHFICGHRPLAAAYPLSKREGRRRKKGGKRHERGALPTRQARACAAALNPRSTEEGGRMLGGKAGAPRGLGTPRPGEADIR